MTFTSENRVHSGNEPHGLTAEPVAYRFEEGSPSMVPFNFRGGGSMWGKSHTTSPYYNNGRVLHIVYYLVLDKTQLS